MRMLSHAESICTYGQGSDMASFPRPMRSLRLDIFPSFGMAIHPLMATSVLLSEGIVLNHSLFFHLPELNLNPPENMSELVKALLSSLQKHLHLPAIVNLFGCS